MKNSGLISLETGRVVQAHRIEGPLEKSFNIIAFLYIENKNLTKCLERGFHEVLDRESSGLYLRCLLS